jgi:hypothetical protein
MLTLALIGCIALAASFAFGAVAVRQSDGEGE